VAADAELVERVRQTLQGEADLAERRMFGGVCFTIGGHMACGVQGEDLVVRVGPRAHAAALVERHVRPMVFTGRPLKGFVYVAPLACTESRQLGKWIRRAPQLLWPISLQSNCTSRDD
jgi:hypothetical protein